MLPKTPMTNIAKIQNVTKFQTFQTRNVPKYRKNCKSNKDFSCYVKRLSNKYGKNCKNNKFNQILRLEREKVKKGFEMSANFAKIAKVTRFFLLCEKTEQQIWQTLQE